jgi:transposase
LRHGRNFSGRKVWSKAHARWLAEHSFENHAHHLVLQETLGGVHDAHERLARIETAIREQVTGWTLLPLVTAIQAMRGIEFIAAVTIIAEIGDLGRFGNPRGVA